MQQIAPNVYVATGFRGCNTTLVVTQEGVVVIDTPMVPAEARQWRDTAFKFGPVIYVINTEPHFDHVGGNSYFSGRRVAQTGTRESILKISQDEVKMMFGRMMPGQPIEPGFAIPAPEITFSERATLYLGNHTFHLIHMPGHTPWQAAVYIPEERVVCTSDNVTQELPFFRQALPEQWLESLLKLNELDVDKLVPGHGIVCDKSYLAEMRTILEAWISGAKSCIARGMSLAEAQANFPLPAKYQPQDERMAMVLGQNIARLYELYTK